MTKHQGPRFKSEDTGEPLAPPHRFPVFGLILGVVSITIIGVVLSLSLTNRSNNSQPDLKQAKSSDQATPTPQPPEQYDQIDPQLKKLLSDTGITYGDMLEKEEESEGELVACPLGYVWDPNEETDEVGQTFSRFGASDIAEDRFRDTITGAASAKAPARRGGKRGARNASRSRQRSGSRLTRRRG